MAQPAPYPPSRSLQEHHVRKRCHTGPEAEPTAEPGAAAKREPGQPLRARRLGPRCRAPLSGPLRRAVLMQRAPTASWPHLEHGQGRPAEPDQCWPRLGRFDSGCQGNAAKGNAAKANDALREPEAFCRETHAPDSSVTEVVDRPTEGVGPDARDRYVVPCAGCADAAPWTRNGSHVRASAGRNGGLRIQNGGPPRTAVPKSQLSGAQAGT
jgi:hypothetical protein